MNFAEDIEFCRLPSWFIKTQKKAITIALPIVEGSEDRQTKDRESTLRWYFDSAVLMLLTQRTCQRVLMRLLPLPPPGTPTTPSKGRISSRVHFVQHCPKMFPSFTYTSATSSFEGLLRFCCRVSGSTAVTLVSSVRKTMLSYNVVN